MCLERIYLMWEGDVRVTFDRRPGGSRDCVYTRAGLGLALRLALFTFGG